MISDIKDKQSPTRIDNLQDSIIVSPSLDQESFLIGYIKLNIMSVTDLRNIKFFGKMSPYIIVEARSVKYKTDPDLDGHTYPIWN